MSVLARLVPGCALALLSACGSETPATPTVDAPKPIPVAIRLLAGNAQRVSVGAAIAEPIVALVVDSAGKPIPNVVVRFFASAGTPTPASATTNAAGQVSVAWTLGTVARDETLQIRTGDPNVEPANAPPGSGVAVTYASATVVAGAPARLEIARGNAQRAPVGGPVPISPGVRAFDRYGNLVAGLAVQFAPRNGSSIGPASEVNGVVAVPWTLGPDAGTDSLDASLPGLIGSGVTFTATAAPIFKAKDLAFRLGGACALDLEGAAWCWSSSGPGQAVPVPVSTSLRFDALAPGIAYSHSCGLVGDAAYCWGSDDVGQLGDGHNTSQPSPVRVASSAKFTRLVVGNQFTCGLDVAGVTYCWGDNSFGQLGDSTRNRRNTPGLVRTSARFTHLTAGGSHVCGLTDSGEVFCWGRSNVGQGGAEPGQQELCSNQQYDCLLLPAKVAGLPRVTLLAAADGYTCGLSGPTWYCWGDMSFMGFGKSFQPRPISTAVVPSSLSLGSLHFCGLSEDGTARCVGANAVGQLGRGDFQSSMVEGPVVGGRSYARVIAGGGSTCAIARDASLFCWGFGPVGDGSLDNRPIPVGVIQPAR